MSIPALRQAASDTSLQPTAKGVYLFLVHEVLDVQEFRLVKQLFVSKRLNVGQSTVSDSLAKLTEKGYLERVDIEEDGKPLRKYRLVYSLPIERQHGRPV